MISILNVTDEDININKPAVTLESLSQAVAHILNYNSEISPEQKTNFDSRSERLKTLIEHLRLDHLNAEEKRSIIDLCTEFNHIAYLEGDILSCTDAITHKIATNTQIPISAKTYRYPECHKEEVNTQINKMLKDGIINESNSPWNAPLWIVPKKLDASGQTKWRIVIDYRKLNEVTVGDSFPLPNITEILDQLGNSKYFTTLDLASGFHQIKLDQEDSMKTAFSTPTGHYEFNRMPFGLRNAPATFQRLMNTVLAGIQGIRCLVYLDDIIVYADSLETHTKKLREVFQRLSEHNLKLQLNKCEFLRREVMYLGHTLSESGVKPNPSKVEAVRDFPIPKSPKEIKSFLGLASYYRRFIPDFSKISKPLTSLLKKDAAYLWTSYQQNSFETLKSKLISEPILQYPDFSKEFVLTTDASNFAIGAVLSQVHGAQDLPIAYASRTLNRAESNYSTIERELLAIVWAVKHFRSYIFGRKFKIVTDHKPLTWLFNIKDPGSRLIRWRLLLEEYEYEIIYKAGKINANADALSRIPNPSGNAMTLNVIKTTWSKKYSDFLNSLQTSIINYDKIEESNDTFLPSSDNYGICISKDLQIHGTNFQEIVKQYPHHLNTLKDQNIENQEIVTVKERDNHIFYLIIKENYWDQASYEDLYKILSTLRNLLVKLNLKSISLSSPGTKFEKFKWEKVRSMLRYIFKETNIHIKIYFDNIKKPTTDQIKDILRENHDSPSAGHSGFHRTYKRIRENYKWPSMKKDIAKHIKYCKSCQENKLVRKKNHAPMQITTTASKAFEKVFLDIVGPLPISENGNKYVLTIQDDLTKFSQAYAIQNHEASTIAKVFHHKFICKYRIPDSILTDQGRDFTSKLLKNVARLFKIKQIQTTAYHPQTNGALERSHATLVDYLKHYIKPDQTDWDEWLPSAMYSYNTTVHTSTKYTPYELVFGEKPEIPTAFLKKPEFVYTYDDLISNIKLKMQKSREIARNHLLQSKERNKTYYDKRTNRTIYKPGDLVYLEKKKINGSKKLSPNYIGPYKIIKINSPVNVTLLIKRKETVVHTDRVKRAN